MCGYHRKSTHTQKGLKQTHLLLCRSKFFCPPDVHFCAQPTATSSPQLLSYFVEIWYNGADRSSFSTSSNTFFWKIVIWKQFQYSKFFDKLTNSLSESVSTFQNGICSSNFSNPVMQMSLRKLNLHKLKTANFL